MKYTNSLDFDQSRFIKELGFDEECNQLISIENPKSAKSNRIKPISNSGLKFGKLDGVYVTSPTYEQATNFFREEYDLFYSLYEVLDENSKDLGKFHCNLYYKGESGVLATSNYSDPFKAESEAITKMIQLKMLTKIVDHGE